MCAYGWGVGEWHEKWWERLEGSRVGKNWAFQVSGLEDIGYVGSPWPSLRRGGAGKICAGKRGLVQRRERMCVCEQRGLDARG